MTMEQELIEAIGFEAKRKYPDRQDYLAAVARATNQVDDEVFDTLSEGAVEWFNAAAKAIGNKRQIEEFDTFGASEPPGDVTEDDDTELEAEVAEIDGEEEVAEEVEEEAPAKPKKKKNIKDIRLLNTIAKNIPPPKKLKHIPVKPRKRPEGDIVDVELDKWSCIVGTKNAAAAELFEGGARMGDVTKSLGGTYYNLLARLIKQGHVIEKGLHGIILLTHKDEVAPKKGK